MGFTGDMPPNSLVINTARCERKSWSDPLVWIKDGPTTIHELSLANWRSAEILRMLGNCAKFMNKSTKFFRKYNNHLAFMNL